MQRRAAAIRALNRRRILFAPSRCGVGTSAVSPCVYYCRTCNVRLRTVYNYTYRERGITSRTLYLQACVSFPVIWTKSSLSRVRAHMQSHAHSATSLSLQPQNQACTAAEMGSGRFRCLSKPFKKWAFAKGVQFTQIFSQQFINKYLLKFLRKHA